MSKKNKNQVYKMARGSWNGVRPVTIIFKDRTKYDRARSKQELQSFYSKEVYY